MSSRKPPIADPPAGDIPDGVTAEAIDADTPETEASEFVHRPPDYVVEELPIDRINVCSQHRNGSNPIQRELNASIERRGLGNAMMVTVLDREGMEEYISFTNRVWGSETSIDDFVPYDESGETFVLLVAGHSRLLSCQAHAEQLGCAPGNYYENARLLEARSVDEIVAWQTEENLHSAPPPQNTARLLAEAWFWQKEQEEQGAERVSRRAFAEKHQVGEQALRDALNFVQLPPDVRGMTDESVLPYSVSVEIGRASETVREWAEAKTDSPDDAAELHRTELLRLATCYLKHEKILMARQEIRTRVQGYRETLGGDEVEQPQLDDFMSLVEEPSALERARSQLAADLKMVDRNLRGRHLGLLNAIAHLAELEGSTVHEGHISELAKEAFELLEGRDDELPAADGELREGETVQVS